MGIDEPISWSSISLYCFHGIASWFFRTERIGSVNEISEKIIGASIEVHRILGPGLLESVYEEALSHELYLMRIKYIRQQAVPIPYKEIWLGTDLRLDLLVEEKVIVDLKAKEIVTAIDRQKLLTYLRLSNKKLGLIINFHVTKLKNGIERIVNGLPEQ